LKTIDLVWKFQIKKVNYILFNFFKRIFYFFCQKILINIFFMNSKDRWDSPLIELREDEETPFEDLVDILIN
jgi:hypothetical protein